ncbi:MAG: BMC domain-containing protein, partial [Cetobacterium sp.]
KRRAELENSIGIVEFWNIPDSVKSLDLVLKSTNVKLLKLVLGWGTAGKSYYVITGDTSSVEEAVVLVTGLFKYKDKAVINNPYEGILKHI